MISLLNYLGCILVPEDAALNAMQNMINNFVKKNIIISDARLYLPPEHGGAGFFNIKNFLSAQQCSWLFRAKKLCIDNWLYDRHSLSPLFYPLLVRCSDINKNLNPILYGIVESFENFYFRFSEKGNNYLNSYVFENNLFLDPLTEGKIDRTFFGNNFYNNFINIIRPLRFRDCFGADGFKTLQEFRNLGLNE
jgi:hypothetical protein